MRHLKTLIATSLLTATALAGCGEDYQPKPRGYFRIDLPGKHYTLYENERFPFSFEMPDSAMCKIYEKKDNAFNIAYPKLRSCIYCDYKPVKNNFREISEDYRNFVYKHRVKADDIPEHFYENPENKVYGLLYEIKGNTASQLQFVLTDSTQHFFRGALYFNVPPNADSLAPVTEYIKEDIVRMMETFKWKK